MECGAVFRIEMISLAVYQVCSIVHSTVGTGHSPGRVLVLVFTISSRPHCQVFSQDFKYWDISPSYKYVLKTQQNGDHFVVV